MPVLDARALRRDALLRRWLISGPRRRHHERHATPRTSSRRGPGAAPLRVPTGSTRPALQLSSVSPAKERRFSGGLRLAEARVGS